MKCTKDKKTYPVSWICLKLWHLKGDLWSLSKRPKIIHDKGNSIYWTRKIMISGVKHVRVRGGGLAVYYFTKGLIFFLLLLFKGSVNTDPTVGNISLSLWWLLIRIDPFLLISGVSTLRDWSVKRLWQLKGGFSEKDKIVPFVEKCSLDITT